MRWRRRRLVWEKVWRIRVLGKKAYMVTRRGRRKRARWIIFSVTTSWSWLVLVGERLTRWCRQASVGPVVGERLGFVGQSAVER